MCRQAGSRLARFATVGKAQAVARMPLERRTATLLAFVQTLEATAQDDVLDLFDIVVTALFTDAAKIGKKARLRTLRDLDDAALQLRQAGRVLMDDTVDDGDVRGAAFTIMPREMLAAALEQIDAIVRPPGDLYFLELRAQTGKLRFLPAMLRSVSFGATPAGQPTLDAVCHLRSTDGRGPAPSAPLGFVPSGWKRQVKAVDGGVEAAGLIRTLQTKDRPTKLARALEELGRLIKTLYLLRLIDDKAYRRRILVQLNRGEGRHQLARIVFHGKRGELRQRYREGQEDQLGALGLVVNVIVLWNTIYMDAALKQLRAECFDVREEDVAKLSPLGFDHINMLGRYALILPDQIARGELRPLRNPATVDDES